MSLCLGNKFLFGNRRNEILDRFSILDTDRSPSGFWPNHKKNQLIPPALSHLLDRPLKFVRPTESLNIQELPANLSVSTSHRDQIGIDYENKCFQRENSMSYHSFIKFYTHKYRFKNIYGATDTKFQLTPCTFRSTSTLLVSSSFRTKITFKKITQNSAMTLGKPKLTNLWVLPLGGLLHHISTPPRFGG